MERDHEALIQNVLEESFDAPKSAGALDNQMELAAKNLATLYWQEHYRQIFDIVEDSFLEGYDRYNIEMAFKNAATVSITYALFSRCFGNPDDYFEPEDFINVFDFNTQAAVNVLGTAVSEMSSQIFMEMERSIKQYERNKKAERSQDYGRNDLHNARGLSNPEPSVGDNREYGVGQVWETEKSLSSGEQYDTTQSPDVDRGVVPTPSRNSVDSCSKHGTADDGRCGSCKIKSVKGRPYKSAVSLGR